MKVYTVASGGVATGIVATKAADGRFYLHVGEEGRGRKLVRVQVPAGAEYAPDGGKVTGVPGPHGWALVLVRDHSGFRGSWSPEWFGKIVNVAEGARAQGDAGRAGGGPEYLVALAPGAGLRIRRTGRLYGRPAELLVIWDGEALKIEDIEAARADAEAASLLQSLSAAEPTTTEPTTEPT